MREVESAGGGEEKANRQRERDDCNAAGETFVNLAPIRNEVRSLYNVPRLIAINYKGFSRR